MIDEQQIFADYDLTNYFGRRDIVRDANLENVEINDSGETRIIKASTIKPVLNALVAYTDSEARAFPSMQRLAEDSGKCLRSVQRAIKALVQIGVLKIISKISRNYVYQLVFEPLKKCANKIRQKLLFFKGKSQKKAAPAVDAETGDPSRNQAAKKSDEGSTAKKTVKAFDDKTRYAAPKFTPPGKSDGQQIQVSSKVVNDLKNEARKLGVKKPTAIESAFERGATISEVIGMIEKFPSLQARNKELTPGALVYWLENGSLPVEVKPTAAENVERQRFRTFASQIKLNLVFQNGDSVDDKFLTNHYWPLVNEGLAFDTVKRKFFEFCNRQGIKRYGDNKNP